MKRTSAIFLLVTLLWPASALARQASPPPREVTWTLTALAGSDPLRLEGYRPSAAFDLTLPQGWAAAADGELSLEYRVSDLVFRAATLTVLLNGHAVASSLFPDRSGTLSFELPAETFQPGDNDLTLEALLPLDNDAGCAALGDPARWVEFGAGSRVRLAVQSAGTPLVVADLPAQFEALGDEASSLVTFVVPEQAGDDELSAMAAVAFALQRGSATHPQWAVVTAGEFQPQTLTGPAILVGAAGGIGPLDSLAPEGAQPLGWVSLARPTWAAGQTVLGVGGLDGKAVLQAAEALLDPAALTLMGSEAAVIGGRPSRTPRVPADQVTLAELGYNAGIVRGKGEHSLIYAFDLPFDWSAADLKLALDLAHGALVDPNVATLTVLLNGSIAFDLRLDAPQAVPHRVQMVLPHNLLRPGRNYLRLSFDLGTPVSSCAVDTEDEPWALVRSDTTLNVPHAHNGSRANLADFPELFGSEVDLADLKVVLPVQRTDADLADALAVVRELSLPGNSSLFAPRIVRAEAITPDQLESHLVVLGEAQRQPVLSSLNNYLLLRFDRGTGQLERSYGIRIPTGSPDLGVVQLLRSPWKRNRLVLVVSGTGGQGYREAVGVLGAEAPAPALAGDLAIVSRSAGQPLPSVYSQSAADVGAVPGVGLADHLLGKLFDTEGPGPMLILVAAALLLLAIPIAVLRYRRGRTGAQGAGPVREQ